MRSDSIKEWIDSHQNISNDELEEFLCEHIDEIEDYIKEDKQIDIRPFTDEELEADFNRHFSLEDMERMGMIKYPKIRHSIDGEATVMRALKSGDGDAVGY